MTAFYEDAEFVDSLISQPPRDELILRMALRDEISDPVAIEVWEARIAELEFLLSPTRAEWDGIYLAAKVQMYRLRYGRTTPEQLIDRNIFASGTLASRSDLAHDLWR